MSIIHHGSTLDRIEAELQVRRDSAEVTLRRYEALRAAPLVPGVHRIPAYELNAMIHSAIIELDWRSEELAAFRGLIEWGFANGATFRVPKKV